MDAARVLREAAKNVPGHWMQGFYGDGAGNYCAVGHIAKALGMDVDGYVKGERREPVWDDDVEALALALGEVILEQYPESVGYHVPNWNDAEGRTEEEVVAMFEKAAVKAEEIG